jgi:hypothetical protein
MNIKTFELELIQLEEAFSKSKNNKYSDHKKRHHFEQINQLFLKIKKEDYSKFNIDDLKIHQQIFYYLFKSLEFLDDSTLNATPYEIVTCLSRALKDWIGDENFIIVTSLSNKQYSFSLESIGLEKSNQLKQIIKDLYDHDLQYRLIKINLPKLLVRDYLSCVVLYHELGHFIDNELNISNRIFIEKFKTYYVSTPEQTAFLNHTKEFFADLFAAQYVSNASNIYLNHIAFENPDSETHPATEKRIKVVEDFLSRKKNLDIDVIQKMLSDLSLETFHIRCKNIDAKKNAFLNTIPHEILDDLELHAVFKLGWDIWLDSDSNFLNKFPKTQRYYIVNNLIEKSISNYNVIETWHKIKEKEIG